VLVTLYKGPTGPGRKRQIKEVCWYFGSPGEALINPGAQEANLSVGERLAFAFWGHGGVRIEPCYIMNQWAIGAVAGDDIDAVVASLQSCRAIVESEPAFRPFRTVTTQARLVEDWFDVAIELDLDCGDRRQIGLSDLSHNGEGLQPPKQDQWCCRPAAKQAIELVPRVVQ
jgi:hypothetical protein